MRKSRGIPQPLLSAIRSTLKDCDEFRNQGQLESIFTVEELSAWRGGLPEASSLKERVDLTISYLAAKRMASGKSVLSLFLRILGDMYDPSDQIHGLLVRQADLVSWLDSLAELPNQKTLEANPSCTQMLWIQDARAMLDCARSVGRIDVPRFYEGARKGGTTGTAWMVAPDLAITCRHVLEARGPLEAEAEPDDFRNQVDNALLTFDYISAGKGVQYSISSLEKDSNDSGLDYVIMKLSDRPDVPINRHGHLQLDPEAPLTMQTSLYIIQHPLGQPQQGAGDTFAGFSSHPGYILYLTPTEAGTSGAPVLNRANWRVVALHQGENSASMLREGLMVKAVLSDLQNSKPDLYLEIMNAHPEVGAP